MTIIAADKKYVVVGLGLTGVSCVRHLTLHNRHVVVVDSRVNPPGLLDFQTEFPSVVVHCGGFDADIINSANVLVMSPGVALSTPAIQNAVKAGVKITSDIELFLAQFEGKVVAITGSNAKSTVTAWLGCALNIHQEKALVAGNIGLPVLDALERSYDLAVLELSSFQLELIAKLEADVATILNVSEDHLDRYESMFQYQQAKQRIYFGAKTVVSNRQDMLTQPLVPNDTKQLSFGLNEPDLNQYGIREIDGELWLVKGFEQIIKQADLSLPGRHNCANALAVIAMADAVGNDRSATLQALRTFAGLPFRCQEIASINGVRYINDSKATNVGSTLAAVSGLATGKNIHLLLGGISKDQDLTPLGNALPANCKRIYAFGRDKLLIKNAVAEARLVDDLNSAMSLIKNEVESGDIVLLSPACASFDQFDNFEHRGRVFNSIVETLK